MATGSKKPRRRSEGQQLRGWRLGLKNRRGRRSPSRQFIYSIDFSPSRNELHDELIGVRLGFTPRRKAEHRGIAQALSFEYVPPIPTRTIWILSDSNGVGLDFWHSRTMRHSLPHFHPNQPVAASEPLGVGSAEVAAPSPSAAPL